jgi:hypothetical protein
MSAGSAARAGSFVGETTETLANASAIDSLFLGQVFGYDYGSTIQFSWSTTDSGSFSYSVLSGQTYQGLPLSLSLDGSFDQMSTYTWTGAGQLGATSWTETGTGVWSGDPTETVNTTIKVGNDTISIIGTMTASDGKSTLSVLVNGFGPNDGTDTYAIGGWSSIVTIPPTGIKEPGSVLTYNASSGTGHFKFDAFTPEPPGVILGGIAFAVYFCAIAYRRQRIEGKGILTRTRRQTERSSPTR